MIRVIKAFEREISQLTLLLSYMSGFMLAHSVLEDLRQTKGRTNVNMPMACLVFAVGSRKIDARATSCDPMAFILKNSADVYLVIFRLNYLRVAPLRSTSLLAATSDFIINSSLNLAVIMSDI